MTFHLPDNKAEREDLIARLFAEGFGEGRYVATQSEPSLAPFGKPRQNNEADLDFTIDTSAGEKLMELAEFAPLKTHGGQFSRAPKYMTHTEKVPLVKALIDEKSAHQGGPGRFLLLYATEQAFRIDHITIEFLRRQLQKAPPNFERVYSIVICDLEEATVSEIYPGAPAPTIGEWSDQQLENMQVQTFHPSDWKTGRTFEYEGSVFYGNEILPAKFTVTLWDLDKVGDT